jgi:peptidyl-prolyl cis-trans isomerase B (cyclophilin B)
MVQQGEPVPYNYYLLSGLTKLVYTDEVTDKQYILAFAMEDWWDNDFTFGEWIAKNEIKQAATFFEVKTLFETLSVELEGTHTYSSTLPKTNRNPMNRLFFPLMLAICFSASGQKQKMYPVGQIKTNKGEILIWLYDETPNHKASFMKLANESYWDTLTFNRVIKDFVAQGGCPDTPEGFSGSPYLLKPEFNSKLRHVYGAVGAGRDGNKEMLSAGCQFYIVQNKAGLARLDDKFTVFGYVFKGMDVVDSIVSVSKDSTNKPYDPIKLNIKIITMSDDDLKKNGFDQSKK